MNFICAVASRRADARCRTKDRTDVRTRPRKAKDLAFLGGHYFLFLFFRCFNKASSSVGRSHDGHEESHGVSTQAMNSFISSINILRAWALIFSDSVLVVALDSTCVSDVLAPTNHRQPPCSEECRKFLQGRPHRTIRWLLVLRSYSPSSNERGQSFELPQNEQVRRNQCVRTELERLGATNIKAGYQKATDLVFEASFDQVQSVILTEAVAGVEIRCLESECDNCFEYESEEDCRNDGLCSVVYASRYNSVHSCIERQVYAACGSYRTCNSVMYPAVGPNGDCWLFNDSCFPQDIYQPTFDSQGKCGYKLFEDDVNICAPTQRRNENDRGSHEAAIDQTTSKDEL